jgi:hypothetical protein
MPVDLDRHVLSSGFLISNGLGRYTPAASRGLYLPVLFSELVGILYFKIVLLVM